MGDSGYTGEKGTSAGLKRLERLFAGRATLQEEGLKGYAGQLATDSPLSSEAVRRLTKKPGPEVAPAARVGRLADASTPAERYAVRKHLDGADDVVSQMVEAASAGEALDLANLGQQLRAHLRELWRLRKAREEEWAEVVNFLQSALAGQVFETFTVEQCQVIKRVVADYLSLGTVDDDSPFRVRRLLESAGFDPWRGISRVAK